MKTAEEILYKHISKFDRNPPHAAILRAMEEYASHPQGMSAEQVEESISALFEELAEAIIDECDLDSEYLPDANRLQYYINAKSVNHILSKYKPKVLSCIPTPSVKPDGCPERIHDKRVKVNNDKYCPICGENLQSREVNK